MSKRKRRQKIKPKRRAHLAHFFSIFYFVFLVSYFISYLQLISLSMHSVISNTHTHTNRRERTYTKLCPKIKDYRGISYFIFVELLLLFLFLFYFSNRFSIFLYFGPLLLLLSRAALPLPTNRTRRISVRY